MTRPMTRPMMVPMTEPMTEPQQELLEGLAESLGFTLVSSRSLGLEVSGDGFISGHEIGLRSADGALQSQVVYLDTRSTRNGDAGQRDRQPRDGVLTMRNADTGDEVAVWLYPKDPALPALPSAVFPDAATVLLRRMGQDAADLELTLVAYRPGKRAVIRAAWPTGVAYLKVVAPEQVAALHARYSRWRAAGLPVPNTLGWTDDGIVVFTELPGVVAAQAIERFGDDARFLDAVERLSRTIARVPGERPARVSLSRRLDWYERRVRMLLEETGDDELATLRTICRRIDATLSGAAEPRPVMVHGDLHVGQLFVDPADPGRICGVLDIDTAGLGDPADDAAALHAHLVMSALTMRTAGDHESAARYDRLADRWRERWTHHEDPGFSDRAHAISATHLLAHTLGRTVPAGWLLERARGLV